MVSGPAQRMRHGMHHTQDPAVRRAPIGATIFLYYRHTRPAEILHNPFQWGHRPGGRGSLHFHCFHHILELMMIYGRSRGLCLARASGCIPLQGCCLLVGVQPTGCLRVALFVTERYLWSFTPLTSHFLPALCADCPLCARAIAQASSGGCHSKTPCVCGGAPACRASLFGHRFGAHAPPTTWCPLYCHGRPTITVCGEWQGHCCAECLDALACGG